MNETIKKDLKYWADKMEYAETKLYGEKAVGMVKTCKMMIDHYLDKALAENRFWFPPSNDRIVQRQLHE